jgi:hypothetical protein
MNSCLSIPAINLLAVFSSKYIDVDLVRGASFVAIGVTDLLACFATLAWGFPCAPALTIVAEAARRVKIDVKLRMMCENSRLN